MKKLLFLLLITAVSYGQTYQNPTFGTVTTKTSPTVTNDPYVTTTGATGIQGKIAPVNLIIPHTPVNYTVPNLTIGEHLAGIDTRLGQISSTTAGLTQRIYFTADNTTVNSVVYFASNSTGKGATAAGSPPALVLADNTKGYFTKDLISIPQPAPTIGYAGSYSGNLTVSATPTPVATRQRFTVEVYRTDNLGTPIASGVSGAPVGDLGVTVVAILDSGELNINAGAITNVAVNGILTQNITINTGERLRYHVSAAKIGAGGGNVTFGVYYGSSYNSYYDVPVAITTDAVVNKSTVTGVTDTDALNTLNTGKANDADVVHKTGNLTETVTGNKTLTGTNTHSGVNTFNNDINANGFISGTVTKVLPSGNTIIGQTFNLTGMDDTSIFNGNYIANLNEDGFAYKSSFFPWVYFAVNNKSTNQPLANIISFRGQAVQNGSGALNTLTGVNAAIVGTGTGNVSNVSFFRSNIGSSSFPFNITSFIGLDLNAMPNILSGGISNSRGILIGDVFGSTIARGIDANVSSGTGKYNFYAQGTAPNYFNGNVLIGTTTSNGNAFRLTGTAELITTPTTSAGTYDILTRNSSTGVVEKVASTAYATTASPTFTGTPTAPTATAGTNTTQIATTAFVQSAVWFRTLSELFTDTSNTTTSQETLFSYTIPAGTLTNNGDRLDFTVNGVTSIANVSHVLNISGNDFFSGSNVSAGNINDKFYIVRLTSTTVRTVNTANGTITDVSVSDLNSNSNVISVKVTATAAGGGTLKSVFVDYKKKS